MHDADVGSSPGNQGTVLTQEDGGAAQIAEITASIVKQVRSPEALRLVARTLIREGAARAEVYKRAIRPIWGASYEGRPEHIGSCVLVEIGSEKLMLTAAHVSDWALSTQLYIGVAQLEPLTGSFEASNAPRGDRELDVLDYAVMRLPADMLSRLGDATFIPEAAIGIGQPVERRHFTCLGFPNSQNRTPLRNATSVRNRQRSYTSRGRPAAQLPGRAQEDVHVLVDFNGKLSRNDQGERVSSGKPNGFSGGAIFDIGELGSLENMLRSEPARLAALFIEGHRKQKVVMGTRIDPIFADLRSRGWI